jgi:integrase
LGAHDSPESRQLYDRIIAEFLDEPGVTFNGQQITIDELCILYVRHAERYYVKDGKRTSEVHCIKAALRPLIRLFGETKAAAFGPKRLKDVRSAMVQANNSRKPINKHVGRIRSMFKWAVAEELLPPTIHAALLCVQGLKAGRTEAKENEPVIPVSAELVHKVKATVSPSIAGLIEFQLLTGARPGEAVQVRLCDITATGEVWEYIPASHKTEHKGKVRRIPIGPRCQELIRPRMTTDTTAPLFPNMYGRAFKVHGYRTAIGRACERLGIPNWSPNQLRHTAATAIRREAGIETARTVLGHSSVDVTEIYAERDYAAARSIIAKIG